MKKLKKQTDYFAFRKKPKKKTNVTLIYENLDPRLKKSGSKTHLLGSLHLHPDRMVEILWLLKFEVAIGYKIMTKKMRKKKLSYGKNDQIKGHKKNYLGKL